MPAEVQFQLYPQGVCYACELTTDFQNFSEGYITDNEGILTKEQKSALSKMQEHLENWPTLPSINAGTRNQYAQA